MSRAGKLLQRLEHIGEPQVNEQDPKDDDGDSDEGGNGKNEGAAAMLQQPQQQQRSKNDNDNDDDAMNIDPQMTNPTSPYSRVTHNPDGSLKADQGDQAISDRGRFVVHRRR